MDGAGSGALSVALGGCTLAGGALSAVGEVLSSFSAGPKAASVSLGSSGCSSNSGELGEDIL